MKKNTFLLPLLVALALTGCSSDEDLGTGNNENGNGESQFLTVNLVTNSVNGTRATGDPNNAEYENGSDAENAVSKVRFYFFQSDGKPANVKKVGETEYVNYMDWTEISNAGDDSPNVEKKLSATLVIQSPKGDETPSTIVAVINPQEGVNTNLSLTELAGIVDNYRLYYVASNFVMSNSVYATGEGESSTKQMAVSVADKIKKTSAEALADPVQIYVERTVAKVRLGSNLTAVEGKSGVYDTQKTYGTDEEKIYVKFLGWNTTAVADKSRLVKDINPRWTEELLGENNPWNWAAYHRSFWAINASDVTYQYGDFNGGVETNNVFPANAKTAFDKTQWVYVNENASDNQIGASPTTSTKVIISAQLVKEDGTTPFEIAEYGSTRTTVEGLKELFANNCSLYRKTTSEGNTSFTRITPSDLDIKTATEVGAASATVAGRYKVYVQLAQDAEATDWYPSNSESAEKLTKEAANLKLKELGSAKVWANGNTYYYFDIKHLGNMNGVVRNHIYDATITSLIGLGTPVYDPNEIIYPEKPEDSDDTYIAAQINILSWRIVNQSVDLEW